MEPNDENESKQQQQRAGNEFFDDGACSISEALKVNTTLKTLNLGCTQQNGAKQ